MGGIGLNEPNEQDIAGWDIQMTNVNNTQLSGPTTGVVSVFFSFLFLFLFHFSIPRTFILGWRWWREGKNAS